MSTAYIYSVTTLTLHPYEFYLPQIYNDGRWSALSHRARPPNHPIIRWGLTSPIPADHSKSFLDARSCPLPSSRSSVTATHRVAACAQSRPAIAVPIEPYPVINPRWLYPATAMPIQPQAIQLLSSWQSCHTCLRATPDSSLNTSSHSFVLFKHKDHAFGIIPIGTGHVRPFVGHFESLLRSFLAQIMPLV